MDIREKLRIKNGIKSEDMKAPADKVRIAQLEQEKADLQVQLEETQMALVELAELLGGAE